MYSQLTEAILAKAGVIHSAPRADRRGVTGQFVLGFVLLWATLMRGLLVRARLLPPTCARCGRRYERSVLGERVCTCGH
jgi:hypothetical protein